MREFYRNTENGMIAGVCAGLSDCLNIPVNRMRFIWIILLFTQIGLPAYIIAALLLPDKAK